MKPISIITINLRNKRYIASYTVPYFLFFRGERGVSTVWDGVIDEPRRLSVNGRQDLCKTSGSVKVFHTDPTQVEEKDDEGNEKPTGYLRYFDHQDEGSDKDFGFDVLVYVKDRYIWDFYLNNICNMDESKDVVLDIQVEGLSVGWEPDGSGSEWEDGSNPLLVKGFTFRHEG